VPCSRRDELRRIDCWNHRFNAAPVQQDKRRDDRKDQRLQQHHAERSHDVRRPARGGAGTVTNAGSIQSATNNGVYLNSGSVNNQAGGVIAGKTNGVYNRNFAITVTNSALIETTGTLNGIYLRGGGSVTNNAGATIAGSAAGVALGQQGGVRTNHGLIKGTIGFDGGIFHSGGNTLINFGTVASTSTVAGADAVEMGNSLRNKLLIVEKGSVFTGLIEGGGRGEIECAATGTAAMGSNISGFETVALANGAADSLTLANANFAGVDGRLTVLGGNSGNTVNASAVTAGQLTIDGGAGTDVLTGNANGGAIFVFTTAALTSTDKIAGGGGFNNKIEVTTPGTVAAGGVSAVEIYQLANGGANSLALVNANRRVHGQHDHYLWRHRRQHHRRLRADRRHRQTRHLRRRWRGCAEGRGRQRHLRVHRRQLDQYRHDQRRRRQ
jgi:hypothetical protein